MDWYKKAEEMAEETPTDWHNSIRIEQIVAGRTLHDVDGIEYMAPFRNPQMPIYEVDVRKTDDRWKMDLPGFYLEEGYSDDRKEVFENWLQHGIPIEVPEIYIDKNGVVSFINGRHRFSVIRDMGKSKTAMNVEFEDPYLLKFIDGRRIG